MAAHDLLLRLGGVNDTIGKVPYFRTAGVDYSTADGPIVYVNNSLEGALFDDSGAGVLTGPIHPNFNFFDTTGPNTPPQTTGFSVTSLSRASGIVSVTVDGSPAHGLAVNDIFAMTGITFDGTYVYDFNGVYKVFQVISSTEFQFIKLGPDFSSTYYTAIYPINGVTIFKYSNSAIAVFDNRQAGDISGLSYTSFLLSSQVVTDVSGAGTSPARKRITPEDLYIRFRIVNSTEDQGGLNSNVFDVIDVATQENVKPILWAWFFGGLTKTTASDFTSADRSPNNIFDILFNSYVIVLRPTGGGSYLEFALLKFNWGEVTSGNWFSNFIDTPLINKYDNVNGTDLGYLISTNPNVAKMSGVSRIVELATSSSFFYDSEIPLDVNLKISIRKHLLSDQSTDNTYYFQLAKNDDYNSFGDGAVYSNLLHSFITRPKTDGLTVITLPAAYTPANTTDIGKDIKDGVTTVGQLAWFDNTAQVWWAKNVNTPILNATALTVDTGVGAGTTSGTSYFDSGLSFVISVGTVNTVQASYLLMPWMYFKFINLDPTAYVANSSKILIDNVLFKQLNSNNKLFY